MEKFLKFSSEKAPDIPADSADFYNRNYFDDQITQTSLYGGEYSDHENFKKMAEAIKQLIGTPNKVLEIGMAKGYLVRRMREVGFDAYGCDISEYAVSKSPEEIKPYVRVADACDLPYQNDEFDYIVSFDTLEHVHPDKVETAILELKRVAKNGLILAIAIHNDNSGREIIPVEERPLPDHLTNATWEWWSKKFQTFGLLMDEEMKKKMDDSEVVKSNGWKIWTLKKF